MTRILKCTLTAALLWASVANAVSQVGGGKISNVEQGFTADLTSSFGGNATVFASDDVQLRGPVLARHGAIFEFQVVNVWMLKNVLPEVANFTDPREFDEWFTSRGWSHLKIDHECIHAFEKTGGTRTIVLAWGSGRGIEMAGIEAPDALAAMKRITETIELAPGACGWK